MSKIPYPINPNREEPWNELPLLPIAGYSGEIDYVILD